MASCEPRLYSDVTPEMLVCLSESVESAFGLSLDGDQGMATAMGTTLTWEYRREMQELTVTCSAKPIFLSCDAIYDHLGSMLKRCRS
jgi:hypothetical protein